MRKHATQLSLFLFVLMFWQFQGCSSLNQALQKIQPVAPSVRLSRVQLSQLSFTGATINFQFAIHNPNPFSLPMKGFHYALSVGADSPLIEGNIASPPTLPAGSDTVVVLPVSFTYRQLFQTIRNVGKQDSIPYTLQATFDINVPVLGVVTIPVVHRGKFPIIRKPQLKIRQLKLNSLTWSGAELRLVLEVKNPNGFPLALQKLNYDVTLNYHAIVSGATTAPGQAPAHQSTILEIPIRLNFVELGRSIYHILQGDSSVPVGVQGKVAINPPLPQFKASSLPFNLQRAIHIAK